MRKLIILIIFKLYNNYSIRINFCSYSALTQTQYERELLKTLCYISLRLIFFYGKFHLPHREISINLPTQQSPPSSITVAPFRLEAVHIVQHQWLPGSQQRG